MEVALQSVNAEMLFVQKICVSDETSLQLLLVSVFTEDSFNFSHIKLPLWGRTNTELISIKMTRSYLQNVKVCSSVMQLLL